MGLVSERYLVPGLDGTDGVRTFVGRPRVFVESIGADEMDPDKVAYWSDLMLDAVAIARRDGPDAAVDARLRSWYGVLETALETEYGLLLGSALDPADRSFEGVSLRMSDPLTVLRPADAATLTRAAPAALAAALQDGLVVVVPGDPETARTWWTIAPGDGTVRSILDPGLAAIGGIGGYVQVADSIYVEQGYMREYAEQVQRRAGLERQVIENMVGIASIAMTAGEYAQLAALFRAVAAAIAAGRFILH
jgi:hypothetical protein